MDNKTKDALQKVIVRLEKELDALDDEVREAGIRVEAEAKSHSELLIAFDLKDIQIRGLKKLLGRK